MLTIITGRSRRLWPRVLDEMRQAHAEGAQRLFLITPDQYTLQAELELVDQLKLPGLLEIEVLSPSRLLTRVFSLAGSTQRIRIDARGKAMMVTDVLRQSKEDLQYFGGAAERPGFADMLAATIADFKRTGKTPEDAEKMAQELSAQEEDALSLKMRDIALMYTRYEQRLAGAFIDSEDAQEELIERLPKSGLLEGSRIWLYGFDMITPQFLRQVAVMARGATDVRFALTWEKADAPDGQAFLPARDAVAQMEWRFQEDGVQWSMEHVDTPLEAAEEIRYLERQLYAIPATPYTKPVEAVSLSVAANPFDEAVRVADRMLAIARDGVPFDSMAVVVGELEPYTGAVEMAFGRSGIPYHLVRSRPAIAHPLIRAWLAAIRCVTRRWRAEDALDWLKGGFSGLTVTEAERLENYALENGLRDQKWKRDIEDAELDDIRLRFVTPLQSLQESLRKARDTAAQLTAMYQLLEETSAYDTLEAWERQLTARGMFTEATGCAQAWRLAMETLDQLHALLKGSRILMKDLAQVVESGFAAAELGTVPATPGVVQVGQLGHMKLSGECRVLFLMGMQDGVMRSDITTLITDEEAERAMKAAGLKTRFSPSADTLAQLKQVNLLDTIAAPTEGLYISHAAAGVGGEAQRPATVLKLLEKVFPDMREEGSVLATKCVAHAPGAALDALGPMLRSAAMREEGLSEAEAETAAWLTRAPQTRLHAEGVLRALEAQPPVERLGQQAAGELYVHTRTSVSRLESFANCPFRHFVSYGLRPIPRREFAVARDETGTFYHRAMEGYSKVAAALPAWPEISREENDAMMNAVLAPLKEEWEHAPLGDNAMLRATGEAFCRVARRAAWTYAGQMRRGSFHTGIVEARFGPGEAIPAIGLMLPDGRKCWVEGRIDRIDFFEDDGERWLRVVDYKSGGTTLEPSRLYGGLQLQLLMYLIAALSAYPGVNAAGAFYSRFDDPLVETDSRDVAEIERLLAKALRLRGIVLSDVRVVRAMDDGEDMLKQDGTPKKRNDIATSGELAALMRHAYTLAGSMADEIATGEIRPRPAQLDQWKACTWCDYHSVCGFDPSQEGHDTRRLEKLSKDELMERLDVDEEA